MLKAKAEDQDRPGLPESHSAKPTVFLVDDDPSMREYLEFLLKSVGHSVEAFAGALEFLKSFDPARPGCLISDIRMPGMDGLELQEQLKQKQIPIPIIIITGFADVPMAVRAVRAGALDFFEKPLDDKQLLERIQQALAIDAAARQKKEKRESVLTLMARLTPRENEIMEMLTSGRYNNKSLAAELRISRKTLDAHRSRILSKMECQNLVELTQKVQASQNN